MPELELTAANFDATVLPSAEPVLVDFWAPWCGPCRLMGPLVEEVAKELDGKLAVGKVNVDDHGDLAQRFNVLSIPTFIVFKGGKQVDQFSGSMSKDDLKMKLEKFV
jgi:thioredoxin 1